MDEKNWWTSAAIHFWRAYFAISKAKSHYRLSPASQKIFDICDSTYHQLSDRDQDIIQTVHTCKPVDKPYIIEDYSARTGIPVRTIYYIISKASRRVIESAGFLDPRDTTPDGTKGCENE